MLTAEQNYRLLQEIEANRMFLLMAYQQNPELLERADARIRQLFEMPAHGVDNSLSPVLRPLSSERGASLIELIMFIVIVSVALAGILLVMNTVTRSSADPLIHKQALAIAESLLEEVELMPFTYCDPDDANATTAAAPAGACAVASNEESTVIGPEGGEGRYVSPQYDNVSDYNGFGMAAGICDITNVTATCTTPIVGLGGYTLAGIVIAPIAFGGITLASGDALLITVTVTGPDLTPVVVEGIRTRYAPRAVP